MHYPELTLHLHLALQYHHWHSHRQCERSPQWPCHSQSPGHSVGRQTQQESGHSWKSQSIQKLWHSQEPHWGLARPHQQPCGHQIHLRSFASCHFQEAWDNFWPNARHCRIEDKADVQIPWQLTHALLDWEAFPSASAVCLCLWKVCHGRVLWNAQDFQGNFQHDLASSQPQGKIHARCEGHSVLPWHLGSSQKLHQTLPRHTLPRQIQHSKLPHHSSPGRCRPNLRPHIHLDNMQDPWPHRHLVRPSHTVSHHRHGSRHLTSLHSGSIFQSLTWSLVLG